MTHSHVLWSFAGRSIHFTCLKLSWHTHANFPMVHFQFPLSQWKRSDNVWDYTDYTSVNAWRETSSATFVHEADQMNMFSFLLERNLMQYWHRRIVASLHHHIIKSGKQHSRLIKTKTRNIPAKLSYASQTHENHVIPLLRWNSIKSSWVTVLLNTILIEFSPIDSRFHT